MMEERVDASFGRDNLYEAVQTREKSDYLHAA